VQPQAVPYLFLWHIKKFDNANVKGHAKNESKAFAQAE
jgi:hypothetical protein